MNSLPTELLLQILSHTTDPIHTVCKAWLYALREVMDTLEISSKHHLRTVSNYSNVQHLILYPGKYTRRDIDKYLTACVKIQSLSLDTLMMNYNTFHLFTNLTSLEIMDYPKSECYYKKGIKRPLCIMCDDMYCPKLTYLSVPQLIPDMLLKCTCENPFWTKHGKCKRCNTRIVVCSDIHKHTFEHVFPNLTHLRITGGNHTGFIANEADNMIASYQDLDFKLNILEIGIDANPELFYDMPPPYYINIRANILVMELDKVLLEYNHLYEKYPMVLLKCNFEKKPYIKYMLFASDPSYLDPKIRAATTEYKKDELGNILFPSLAFLFDIITEEEGWASVRYPLVIGMDKSGEYTADYEIFSRMGITIDMCSSIEDSTIYKYIPEF